MPNCSRYPRNDAAKRCAVCHGQFGLVRYYTWRTALCSKKCLEKFKCREENDRRWLLQTLAGRIVSPNSRRGVC